MSGNGELEFHPASEIFPLMTGALYEGLKKDIKEHGLRESIKTYGGKIIDGRNRYRACEETDTDPLYEEIVTDDPVRYVVSLNLHRRHLDESQRSMVAEKIANINFGDNQYKGRSIDLPAPAISQSEAAALLNVSEPSVKRARKVSTKGTPELASMVERGEVSVYAAAAIADLPTPKQKEIVASGPERVKQEAKKVRSRKQVSPIARGTFEDARCMLSTLRDIRKQIKSISGMKPKGALRGEVKDLLRDTVSDLTRILKSME